MVGDMTIKKRLILTGIVVFVTSTAFVGLIAYSSQMHQLKESLRDLPKNEGRLFYSILDADADGLARSHAGLSRIDNLLRPFANRKRNELLAAAKPIFADLKKHNNITHMYFIEPDGTVLLRAHKPEQFGDKLTRATYQKAAATHEIASGIEMGKNFFSLRSVHPVSYRGKPIGYLEVAEEIDHVFKRMKEITGNDVSIFLTEDFLKSQATDVKNEKVGDFTILDSTDREGSQKLAGELQLAMSKGLQDYNVAIVNLAGKKYAVGIGPVRDAFGTTVGVLFSQRDVTPLYSVLWLEVGENVLVFAMILLVAALSLFLSLRKSMAMLDEVKGHILAVAADGDLTCRLQVGTCDEIGELGNDLNQMTEKLAEMVTKVHKSSDVLSDISRNIFNTSKQVIKAAELQAKGVTETSSAVTEINASVNEVAHGVDSLSLSASESSSSILEMAASIEEVALNVETLALSVEEVSSSIIEMAASIKQIGHGVQTLMEASTTTASSVAQMDSSIRQVEKNAMDTAAISEEVRRDAETGKAAVDATITGMNEIRRSSRITTEVMETLSERVSDIGAILSVINEVAEQTNLLALNAAIIAAQAGERGKGFAVVADEIKELAMRTSSSTREITTLIKGVQEETNRAVTAISQAEKRIADGEELSQKSGEALEKIVHGVQRATDQVGEIARATVEQARGSQVIREAMEQVSEMVGQIVNASREQANGSELIMGAVERMKGLTGQVRNSAREQSKVGGLIARSTENITGRIQQIKNACDEQTKGSAQIVHAVEDIQQSTNVNLEATRVMDEAVTSLSRQIEILQRGMTGFKVNSSQ